jgi:RNA-splicing ligase RtcB
MSSSTIYRVLGSENIEDYRRQVNAQADESRAKRAKVEKSETKTVNEMLNEVCEKKPTIDFSEADIQIIIDVLNKILEKVTTIADNTDRGRGLFRR